MTAKCVTTKGVACKNCPFVDGYCWLHRDQKPVERWLVITPQLLLPVSDYKRRIAEMRAIEKLRRGGEIC